MKTRFSCKFSTNWVYIFMPNVFTSSHRYDKVHSIMLVSFVWIRSKRRRADLSQDQKRVSEFFQQKKKKKVFAQRRSDFYLFSPSLSPCHQVGGVQLKSNAIPDIRFSPFALSLVPASFLFVFFLYWIPFIEFCRWIIGRSFLHDFTKTIDNVHTNASFTCDLKKTRSFSEGNIYINFKKEYF